MADGLVLRQQTTGVQNTDRGELSLSPAVCYFSCSNRANWTSYLFHCFIQAAIRCCHFDHDGTAILVGNQNASISVFSFGIVLSRDISARKAF